MRPIDGQCNRFSSFRIKLDDKRIQLTALFLCINLDQVKMFPHLFQEVVEVQIQVAAIEGKMTINDSEQEKILQKYFPLT